jgi:hypothetical protein
MRNVGFATAARTIDYFGARVYAAIQFERNLQSRVLIDAITGAISPMLTTIPITAHRIYQFPEANRCRGGMRVRLS